MNLVVIQDSFSQTCQKKSQDFQDVTNDQNNSNIFKSALVENSHANAGNTKLPKKRKLASDLNDSKSNFRIPKQYAEYRLEYQALTNVKMFANTEL